jgi:acetyl esterase
MTHGRSLFSALEVFMPHDPQIQAMLGQGPGMGPARNYSVEQLRATVRQYSTAFPPLDVALASVEDRRIPGPAGPIPVRVYTPRGEGPFAVLVYFHGGGWVVGDLDTQDMICRGLCFGAGCVVVSVDYRLAPEHPFPAAIDDAFAATAWVAANASHIGGDAARIAVGGDSAGGLLAGGVSLRARDEGGPALRGQVLFYASMNYELSDLTPSMREFAEGPLLSVDDIEFFWHHYLPNPAVDQHHPWASPARASDHSNLPPAFIGSAEIDPTRDAAERYGELLERAGVAVELHRYAGMPHGFVSWLGVIDGARRAVDDASAWLRARLV